ncbi:hypothetical protein SCB49_01824, partial [unidentified eubacterium SCB49]
MKKLLYILFLLPCVIFAQEVPIMNTTVNTCVGTFVDTGGSAGNYGSNQGIIFTICPDAPGEVSRVNFTFFETQLNEDVLTVYEGANNLPAFEIGSYSGTNSPGNILGDLAIDGGCLTFAFFSNNSLTMAGWEAEISCSPPCQSVNAVFDSSVPPIDPAEGVILACPGEPIAFNGSGLFSDGNDAGAVYEWFFSDGTSLVGQSVMKTFAAGGYYEVDLTITDAFGCESVNDIGVIVQVGTVPDFTGTGAAMDPICLGDAVILTGAVEPVPFEVNCTIPVAEIVELPDVNDPNNPNSDGIYDDSTITVDCFPVGAVVENASDILEICVNMEHSYLGDLEVFMRAPDGTEVLLFDGGTGGNTNLGLPNSDDFQNPGVGFDYCFNEATGTTNLVNGNTVTTTSNEGGVSIEAGDYLPDEPFSGFIGVPLNGDWTIVIIDNIGLDNGYIFSWFVNFDPGIIPADAAFEPVITSEAWDASPDLTPVGGNNASVLPTTVGQHCYTYRVTDDFGCEHTQEVCIDVLPSPTANEPDDILICDDGTGVGVFNLTQNTPVVLGTQNAADFTITYHNSQADADAGVPEIGTPGAYPITGTSEIIYVRIDDNSGQCYDTASFEIQFLPVAVLDPITDLLLCDDNADGFELVNIPFLKDTEVLNGQNAADYIITYHESAAEANADINALPVPYNAPAPGQEIFVRIENSTQNIGVCYLVNSFDLGIYQAPPATQPTPYVLCDEMPNDGFAIFDLTTKNVEVTAGNPEAEVLYFESLDDAQMNNAPINPDNAYQNTMAGFQTLFVRVQNVNNADCHNIVTLDIQVNNSPEILDPIPNYFLCDNDEDFVEVFDLTSKDDEIENGLVDVTTTYYDTLADAENGVNPIPNPDAYTSGNNEIYAVVENNLGCQTIGSFLLVLGTVPEYSVPLAFEQCDFLSDGIEDFDLNEANDQIINGGVGISVTYFGNMLDAENATNPLVIPYESMGGETVWVRIEDDVTGCYGVESMELVLVPLPTICEPEPLVFCDVDNDGIGEFILEEAESEIRCGDPSGNLDVTYHETPGEAASGLNPIPDDVVYLNINAYNQTIYVRLTDLSTGCYDTTLLELVVGDSPEITQPDPIILCDDNGDGVEIFDLYSVEAQLLAGVDETLFTVEYFEYQANADSGVNPIVNAGAYPNQPALGNPQIIYIVVTDIDSGCSSQTTVELFVNQAPAITTPAPLVLCETSTPPDGIEIFDLTQTIAEITGGDNNILVTFFETQALLDTDDNANAIADPTAFENLLSNPQDVYIRAEDLTTGCVEDEFILQLRVENAPSPEEPTPLIVCDDNNDGFGFFTLTDKDAEIIGNELNLIVSYYESYEDAFNEIFPIVDVPYENFIQYQQTVYVRVEYDLANGGTGCFTIIELDLIVIDSPEIPLDLEPLIACDDDGDGVAEFDLTAQDLLIYGDQDPDDFTLTYHLSELDAIDGVPVISDPENFTNTSNPQTIWYRLDNNDGDNFCNAIGSFELQVVDGPTIIDPTPFTVCDDLGEENDGIYVFDLTLKNDEITGGVAGLSVQYFLLEEDAQANENPISPANEHMNVEVDPVTGEVIAVNPQNVYVRVLDTNTGCVAFKILELRVEPRP